MVAMMAAETPVGRRVRALREERGWTQEELAKYADVPRGWLGPLELGDIKSPGAARVEKLARALGTTGRYLMTGQQPTSDIDIADPDLEILFRQLADPDLPAETRETIKDFIRFSLQRHWAKYPDSKLGR